MIDALRTFIVVVEGGSLSAAAALRNVAVSSVSRKLDALEAELGAKLLQRGSRRVLLTDAGDQFLPKARRIVAELDDAKTALLALDADPHGLLTITAPAAFGRRHLIPVIASFRERYPSIDVELHVSDRTVDLAAQRVDVAVRIARLGDSDLVATRLAPLRRLACASPAYLARRGQPQRPEALLQHDCLTVTTTQAPTGWWCFAGVQRGTALQVRGPLKTDDTESLLQAAVSGLGIVHLASWLVCDAVATGQLVQLFDALPPSPPEQEVAIHAVRLPGRSHTVKARLFIAHMKDRFGAPPYWDRAAGGTRKMAAA